jgi:GNAT superfamily N-acetyltransferase
MFSFRQAGLADAAAVGAGVAAGFEGYREFAPPFWRPPLGQVSFVPATAGAQPVDEPQLAHLSGLFVEPSWWGSALATRLHVAALEEAAARGYTAMRLFTPAGQARVRRFYEREGWAPAGGERDLAGGLAALEYQRELL